MYLNKYEKYLKHLTINILFSKYEFNWYIQINYLFFYLLF